MINSGRYLALADHADIHANAALDPALQAVLLRLAAQWRGLAALMSGSESAGPAATLLRASEPD